MALVDSHLSKIDKKQNLTNSTIDNNSSSNANVVLDGNELMHQ